MRESTSSGGRTQKSLERLNLLDYLAGLVAQANAETAAIIIQVLRDNRDLAGSKLASKIMHQAQAKIKGTDWWNVLYGPEMPLEDRLMLQRWRKSCDEAGHFSEDSDE